ncbi:MFS transporter small subunit [Actinoplanes sp. CA-054009]
MTTDPGTTTTSTLRLVLSWLLVAILLGYGIIQTVITAAKLFE